MKKILFLMTAVLVIAGCSKSEDGKLTLSANQVSLYSGDTKQVTVNDNATWSSKSEFVAEVSEDGIIKGNHVGKTIITATSDNGEALCEVVVNAKYSTYTEPVLEFDVKNINNPTVPHIGIPNPFGTYSTMEIQSFLRKAMECITGIDHTHTGKTIKGYLQLTVGKSIYKAANDLYDQYVPVRKQSIIDFLEQQKTMYLNALVSDKEEFDRKDALLRSINAQVQSFKDSIR